MWSSRFAISQETWIPRDKYFQIVSKYVSNGPIVPLLPLSNFIFELNYDECIFINYWFSGQHVLHTILGIENSDVDVAQSPMSRVNRSARATTDKERCVSLGLHVPLLFTLKKWRETQWPMATAGPLPHEEQMAVRWTRDIKSIPCAPLQKNEGIK